MDSAGLHMRHSYSFFAEFANSPSYFSQSVRSDIEFKSENHQLENFNGLRLFFLQKAENLTSLECFAYIDIQKNNFTALSIGDIRQYYLLPAAF